MSRFSRLDGGNSFDYLSVILYFASVQESESESEPESESESIRSPESEPKSESESEQPHHDSAPLV